MNAWEQFSQLFLRPEVMFILMLVVIYGFIGELSSPGAILPGVAGAIALLLVLYMSSILPVNVTGLVLIGLAITLFIVDIFAPTHGVLTVGGIVAFFLGAMMLFSQAGPGYRLSPRLDHSGDAPHGGVFHFRRRQGNSRPVQTHPIRQGNDARPDGERALAD